jgi:rhodanese-related sulfurtransferase/peroxiredoxin
MIAAMLFSVLILFPVTSAQALEEVTLEQLADMYKSGADVPLIDVRTPEEFNLIHFKGAVNIPEDQAGKRTGEFAEKQWILYCRTGRRAGEVATMLQGKGIDDIKLLKGGIAQLPLFLKQHNNTDPDTARALQKNVVASIPAVGFPLPDFEVSGANGKQSHPLVEFRGKVVVILFWKPGDQKSDKALQQAVAFVSKNKGVAMAAIPFANSDPKDVEASLKAAAYGGATYMDPLGETAKALNAGAAPTFLVVDADGILLTGALTGFDEKMITQGDLTIQQIVEQSLAGNPMRFPDTGLYAEKRDPNELMGLQAPLFSLQDSEGREYDLKKVLASKPAVLVFFSLGCPHSRNQLTKLAEYELINGKSEKYQILAVTPDGGPQYSAQIHQFANTNGIEFPVVYDPTGNVMYQYSVSGVPEWVVVDQTGVIRHVAIGYFDNTEQILNDALAQMKN